MLNSAVCVMTVSDSDCNGVCVHWCRHASGAESEMCCVFLQHEHVILWAYNIIKVAQC